MSKQHPIDLVKEKSLLKELHAALHANAFSFIAPGEYLTSEVHALVQEQYPELCRDAFLCRYNCKSGNDSPEWHHRVRRTLQQHGKLKKNGRIENVRRGVWKFK